MARPLKTKRSVLGLKSYFSKPPLSSLPQSHPLIREQSGPQVLHELVYMSGKIMSHLSIRKDGGRIHVCVLQLLVILQGLSQTGIHSGTDSDKGQLAYLSHKDCQCSIPMSTDLPSMSHMPHQGHTAMNMNVPLSQLFGHAFEPQKLMLILSLVTHTSLGSGNDLCLWNRD